MTLTARAIGTDVPYRAWVSYRTFVFAVGRRTTRERRYLNDMAALITKLSAAVRRDEEGQGLAEYALILALIAIVVIAAVIFLGGQINTIMSNVGTSI
jgi:pilus assembly protein Flp/PilA